MRHQAARLKELKGSVRALQDPDTQQYFAIADEDGKPRLTELHLATLAPAHRPECLEQLITLASRRLAGVPYELVRIDGI
jgi:hypothetical protein